jgi:hypothetical protein
VNNDNETNKRVLAKLEKIVAFSQHFDYHICILSVLFINHTTCVVENFHQRIIENEKKENILKLGMIV